MFDLLLLCSPGGGVSAASTLPPATNTLSQLMYFSCPSVNKSKLRSNSLAVTIGT